MEICNTAELVKNVEKIHLFLPKDIVFSLDQVLREVTQGLTLGGNSLSIRVLPEDVVVDSKQKRNKTEGVYWDNSISFNVLPQKKTTIQALDSFTNKRVVIGLELTDSRVFVYGNTNQTLHYLFEEVNSTNQQGIIGYKVIVYGKTTTSAQILTTTPLS